MIASSVRPSNPCSCPLISVVVCTYDRARLLSSVLETLCNQDMSTREYEVIIVDNNSTDDTRRVAESFCKQHQNVHHYFELRQGLSHARNRGWHEAQGEYVAYVDDDCRVPEHWAATAKKVIESICPGVFGGPYYAFYDTVKPRWFKDTYGSHDHGSEARYLSDREYLAGGNIVIRRKLLETLGGFDPKLGMSGEKIAYGEETLFMRRMRAAMPGEYIYYEPRLYVHHLVRAEKMSMRWIIRKRFAGGRYAYLTLYDDKPRQRVDQVFARFVNRSIALIFDSSIGVVFRNQEQYPYVQNYLYERTFNHLISLGLTFEQMKHL